MGENTTQVTVCPAASVCGDCDAYGTDGFYPFRLKIVTLMGLMGFIRSGLRMNWHIYGYMQDTSAGAFTPSIAYMGWTVSLIVILFLALVAFVFWLAGLADKKKKHA